ncbi:MAG TPA: SRPBCC family protein [Solirubrobacteraceae bacterium]|nr:SRPBCC family protein [Solirubrobacteraceae bacterium]
MPTTRRSRVLAAPPGIVWRTVGDPTQLPRWWPKVVRVEGADARGFTEVLATERGRSVRADFVVLERRAGELLRFRQEVQGTPFERILRSAETEVRVDGAGDGASRVTLEQRQRLRGVAALGGFLVRRATRRILDGALDGLEEVHGRAA